MENETVTKTVDLKHRMYVWTLGIVKMVDGLNQMTSNDVIARQIIRSGTSVCANYVEGQAASSKKDFINYLHISLKSANESKYWLALLRDLKKVDVKKIEPLLEELQEISNILPSSLITLKRK